MNFLLSSLGIGALGLVVASAACSTTPCDVSCGALGGPFPLSLPCGEPPPTSLTVSGPCTLGPGYAGVTALAFTSDGTCHVTATFSDGTTAAADVSQQYHAPTPGQCCSGGEVYTGLTDFNRVQLGGTPCTDGGGYFPEDAATDASGE